MDKHFYGIWTTSISSDGQRYGPPNAQIKMTVAEAERAADMDRHAVVIKAHRNENGKLAYSDADALVTHRDKVNWDNSPDAYWNSITRREEAPLEFGAYFSRTREVMDTASATIYAHTWEEADAIAKRFAQRDEIEYTLAAEIDTDFDYTSTVGDAEAWYTEVREANS